MKRTFEEQNRIDKIKWYALSVYMSSYMLYRICETVEDYHKHDYILFYFAFGAMFVMWLYVCIKLIESILEKVDQA